MRYINLVFFMFWFSVPSLAQVDFERAFGDFFHSVQMEPVFKDSKTFPDCVPLFPPKAILERYEQQKNKADFDLKTFVLEHFKLPESPASGFQSDLSVSLPTHIKRLWPVLTRQPGEESKGSLIALPFPYVVPGGRFNEIYYWDSYFTILGLQVSEKEELVEAMVQNFAHLINTVGFIPNGNRTYYTSRSQPPFFALMVETLAQMKNDSILLTYLPQLQKEYDFWMDGSATLENDFTAHRRVVRLDDGVLLNRYWDDHAEPRPEAYKEDVWAAEHSTQNPEDLYRNIRAACESGWDFTSRWMKDGATRETLNTTDLIPVDLNCLMLKMEEILAIGYEMEGDEDQAWVYKNKVRQRKEAIQRYCWNDELAFYFDYDFTEKAQTPTFSLAAAFPLFFNLADEAQAVVIAEKIESDFLKIGGLISTLESTGEQWDAPNGWPPLQWITYKGLKNYGMDELADEVRDRWMATNERVYEHTGKMVEKYNVMDADLEAGGGEYPLQDGFGWSNGVYMIFMQEKKAQEEKIRQQEMMEKEQ